ncbi:MAG: hypothetical protein GQ559_05035, partial [Desulfobulbaceae bacterium]|nr:hypothetical protein [Desulfobulbaceae bacterium]
MHLAIQVADIQSVVKTISKTYGCTIRELKAPGRNRRMAEARHLVGLTAYTAWYCFSYLGRFFLWQRCRNAKGSLKNNFAELA